MEIPNELLFQLQARFDKADIEDDWNLLSRAQKTKEIDWCIDRCYMDYEDNTERKVYLRSQIKQLEKLKSQVLKEF